MLRTAASDFTGKVIVVMGLGRFGGGCGVSRWLCRQGAHVTVTDQASAADLADSIRQLAGLPIRFQFGGHDPALLEHCDLLVVNPAVDKPHSAFFQQALQRRIPVTTEINLFVERCPAKIVGVTGSLGKSTIAAMLHVALAAAGKPAQRCWFGGNIGRCLLGELALIQPADWVVLELSSFMLEDLAAIRFSPAVAVVSNLVGHHLDRHGSLAAYTAAKQNILRFQKPGDAAILNGADPALRSWPTAAGVRLHYYSSGDQPPLDLAAPGAHNQSNARAALAVVEALGLDTAAALAALRRFSGLPHRLQLVHASPVAGRTVRWFNDSKATTPQAALTALAAFPPRGVICIVGGYDKHVDMSALTAQLARRAGGVLGIGATGAALVEAVRRSAGGADLACDAAPEPLPTAPAAASAPSVAGSPDAESCRCRYVATLEAAVRTARQWLAADAARRGPLRSVLLSPACASYDQFANYEQRGERFAQLAASDAL